MVKLKVRDLMRGEVVSIDAEKTVAEAAKFMVERGLGSLIVVEGGEPVGIITERDLTRRVVAKGLPLTTKVGEVASKPLITIGPDETLLEAINVMKRNGIRRLGVKEGGKLIGVLSYADFLNNWYKVSKYLLIEVLS
ncbi:MAG: CBS domain-containing protein [Candidatus Nezhaarchaeales archaeon]